MVSNVSLSSLSTARNTSKLSLFGSIGTVLFVSLLLLINPALPHPAPPPPPRHRSDQTDSKRLEFMLCRWIKPWEGPLLPILFLPWPSLSVLVVKDCNGKHLLFGLDEIFRRWNEKINTLQENHPFYVVIYTLPWNVDSSSELTDSIINCGSLYFLQD